MKKTLLLTLIALTGTVVTPTHALAAMQTVTLAAADQEREDAIKYLDDAITNAETELERTSSCPSGAKRTLNSSINTAKKTLADAKKSDSELTNDDINSAATTLNEQTALFLSNTDYYLSALETLDHMEQLAADDATLSRTIKTTRISLEIGTRTAMQAAMLLARTSLMAYVSNVESWEPETDFTGMLANHSFDIGTMDNWYGITFDLNKLDIENFDPKDLSSLADCFAMEMLPSTTPVLNKGVNARSGGHQKYYLRSQQCILQPVLGLPGGTYRIDLTAAGQHTTLGRQKIFISTISVPNAIIKDMLTDVAQGKDIDMEKYMPLIFAEGEMAYDSQNPERTDRFFDISTEVEVLPNSVVVIALNCGLMPVIGSGNLADDKYNADNLRLTLLKHNPGTTNLSQPNSAPLNSTLMNLSGLKVTPTYKGIVIRNGKKMVQ